MIEIGAAMPAVSAAVVGEKPEVTTAGTEVVASVLPLPLVVRVMALPIDTAPPRS